MTNLRDTAVRLVARSLGRRSLPVFVLPLILGSVLIPLARDARTDPPPMLCNGHAELCDRPFDEVVFPATHNSMSNADGGWVGPFQEHGISEQLNDGVRMLLIDSHSWETPKQSAAFARHLSPALRASFTASESTTVRKPGVYLCHLMCGLGSTPLASAMTDVSNFLATHPDEVMSIFFEDYVPADQTAAVFDATGLTRYTFVHVPGTPWPTLRQMIDSGHRLLVMSEHEGPPPAWYESGWDLTQDTNYAVKTPARFTCALDRGKSTNDLFLLNNWILAPIPSQADARIVNSYSFLFNRARECERERQHVANFVAVNFYGTGDLMAVVDALNGVSSP